MVPLIRPVERWFLYGEVRVLRRSSALAGSRWCLVATLTVAADVDGDLTPFVTPHALFRTRRLHHLSSPDAPRALPIPQSSPSPSSFFSCSGPNLPSLRRRNPPRSVSPDLTVSSLVRCSDSIASIRSLTLSSCARKNRRSVACPARQGVRADRRSSPCPGSRPRRRFA